MNVKMCVLTWCFIFVLLLVPGYVFSAVQFEQGPPSQIRELILKQKQEKQKIIQEKYKKPEELQETKVQAKEKFPSPQQSPSFIKLKGLLVSGLLLLAILGIVLGFIINAKRK
ncbi:MAG: hypothetical protein AB1422_08465 [bacterium]